MSDSLDYHNTCITTKAFSSINSRKEIKISSRIFNQTLKIPIIASPMKDVVDFHTASDMKKVGALAIMHRFQNIEEQKYLYSVIGDSIVCSLGISEDFLLVFRELYNCGVRNFCIDVANGANKNVLNFVKRISSEHEDINLILGNFLHPNQCLPYKYIDQVCGFRVGVAGGMGCSTRNATGIYYPSISLIQKFKSIFTKHKMKKAIIADGGIREPQDFCKALLAGADFVMMGSVIAACKDSPAATLTTIVSDVSNYTYKIFSGSASFKSQTLYKSSPQYIEGKTVNLKMNDENVSQLISRFYEGLQSSMSYCNAKNLTEYRKNAKIIKID